MKKMARALCVAAALVAFSSRPAASQSFEAGMRAVAAIAGEPSAIGAAGLSANDEAVLTLENDLTFDYASGIRRLVIVGGPGGEEAVFTLARWFKETAPARLRQNTVQEKLSNMWFDHLLHRVTLPHV